MPEKYRRIFASVLVVVVFFVYGAQYFYRSFNFLISPTHTVQARITSTNKAMWYVVKYQYTVNGAELEGEAKGIVALEEGETLELRYLLSDESRSMPEKFIVPNMIFGLVIALVVLGITLVFLVLGLRRKLPEKEQSEFDSVFRKREAEETKPGS